MELVYEFSYHAILKEALPVGPGPFGTRLVAEVIGGRAEGPRIKGRVLTGGADWLLVGPDGWGRLDVRAQFLTDDGAAIYVAYFGLLEMNDAVQQALAAGRETAVGDQYFRSNPRFECGDPRYTWLTQAMFIGEGRIIPGPGVEYRVFRVT